MLRPVTVRVHAFALAILVACGFFMHPESYWRCGPCGSGRDDSQWRFGFTADRSIPLSLKSTEIRESDAARGLFGPGHAHSWTFANGRQSAGFLAEGYI